jgi:hypothetical protein
MSARALHSHTYFLFPFSVDKEAVRLSHPESWPKGLRWLDGLDSWLRTHSAERAGGLVKQLGPWKRDSYTRFDLDSQAYQDMVFFHPFMRRVFFDIQTANGKSDEGLLRCYVMSVPEGSKLWFEACDAHGGFAAIEITDLRLFMFANGMGVLSFGVEASDMPISTVLWINESLRKVYPSSERQIQEGRIPCDFLLVLESTGERTILVEETELSKHAEMMGVLPPLAKTITGPLYFLDYSNEEFEPVLDERMVVYSYVAIDPATVPDGFRQSEEYQILLSRILYVDRDSDCYRYSPDFVRQAMHRQLYSRWAHQGTYYGFTSYSNITVTLGTVHRDLGSRSGSPLVHKMFTTRYYMMALVALFYRATLLDFAERTALVSKTLYLDQWDGELKIENIKVTDGLRAEFLHFSSHWYFTELANKDEETEHFDLQCVQYRIEGMHKEISDELDALNASLHNYHQFRNTEALNRLGMLSMILGAGAVTTGFFGMNFQIESFTEGLLKGNLGVPWAPYVGVAAAIISSFGALLFGIFLIISNWSDYKDTLLPNRWRAPRIRRRLLKKNLTN